MNKGRCLGILMILLLMLGNGCASAARWIPEASAGKVWGEGDETGVEIGMLAPDFTLPLLNGGQIQLSELQGKPVFINFFTTWCGPCEAEMPDIQRLYDELGQEINFVGVSVGEQFDVVEAFIQDYGYTYPIAYDEGSTLYNDYPLDFIPQSYFLDQQGVIRAYIPGAANEEEFRNALERTRS